MVVSCLFVPLDGLLMNWHLISMQFTRDMVKVLHQKMLIATKHGHQVQENGTLVTLGHHTWAVMLHTTTCNHLIPAIFGSVSANPSPHVA